MVNNAILSFRRRHPFLLLTLEELAINFDSRKWGNQGPSRITACIYKYCNIHDRSVLEGEYCTPKGEQTSQDGGFSVLNHSAGYPIGYGRWQIYFDGNKTTTVAEETRSSIAIHYWNHMRATGEKDILLDPKHPLYKIFRANCPITEAHLLQHLVGSPY